MKNLADRCIFPVAVLLALSVVTLFYQIFHPAGLPVEADARPQVESVELPVVMYHHILKEQDRLNKYTISPGEFRQDMEFIRSGGYTPVSMAELIASVNGGPALPQKPILITFDDGYESFHEYAYPVLQEYGYKAVFSVVGRYADQYTESQDHHVRYSHCEWGQLEEMRDSGLVEIGNHTYNMHANQGGRHGAARKEGESSDAYRQEFLTDVGRMQEVCYEYLGEYPAVFTYPFGQISPEALPMIKEMGFQAALICQEKFNFLTGNPEELYHLNRFNRPHGTSLQTILERARAKLEAEQRKNGGG